MKFIRSTRELHSFDSRRLFIADFSCSSSSDRRRCRRLFSIWRKSTDPFAQSVPLPSSSFTAVSAQNAACNFNRKKDAKNFLTFRKSGCKNYYLLCEISIIPLY